MVAKGLLFGALCALLRCWYVGRTFTDRPKARRGVGFCLLRTSGGAIGTSVILRWRVSGLECELEMTGAPKRVSVRQDGQIVRSATVESAVAAHEWASEQSDLLNREQRQTG